MRDIKREQLGRKCATFAAVIAVGFLSGWSASGLSDGVVLAVALGAGTAVPIFSDKRADSCLPPRLRRRGVPPR